MKKLGKRVIVLALCFTLIMSCVVEATPQDLQNMSGRDITAAFKAQKLKVKKAKYGKKAWIDWSVCIDFKGYVFFNASKKKNSDIKIEIFDDSDDAINYFVHCIWLENTDAFYSYSAPKYEYFRRGNIVLTMNRKISKKVRNKYKNVIKDIYNRPAQVADQKQ